MIPMAEYSAAEVLSRNLWYSPQSLLCRFSLRAYGRHPRGRSRSVIVEVFYEWHKLCLIGQIPASMKNATLRQLKVFESVARHLSFTRAAAEMHLTQSAMSTQVKELEHHAGLPLFEQLGRKVHLTQAGTELLRQAREIVQQFREAEEAMQQLKGIAGGKLNVAVISAGDYFFPRLLAEFMRRHPGVVLTLTVHNRRELLHHLVDNLTDLAIVASPPKDMDTVNEPFAPHPYVIVAPPNHPLAG